jgi:UDP-N-acetylmuramoylalanine--D-glutamate ligase
VTGPAPLAGRRVVVAGIGVSGFAAATALAERDAQVVVVDERAGAVQRERAATLTDLGATVRLGTDSTAILPEVRGHAPDLVIASPRWRPDEPVLAAAAATGTPVWGEAELAWRLRPAEAAPWLSIAGSNGKSTTARILTAILAAAGLRATTAGSPGSPLLPAVLHAQPYDVIVAELTGAQLRRAPSVRPAASACLNIATEHLDRDRAPAYTADTGLVYGGTERACVYNVADPVTERLLREADVAEGCRAVGFTLGAPAVSQLGLVDEVLADRAFIPQRQTSAAELATLDDVRAATGGLLAPHLVADALAAAALARASGVPPAAVRDGLRGTVPYPHRLTPVAEAGGVRWVDDSAAVNPHAAGAALAAFESVVWVAGGPSRGVQVDELVRRSAARLRAVVLCGRDRQPIRAALARHAPQVPVTDVAVTDTGRVGTTAAGDGPAGAGSSAVMDAVVEQAAALARPGDTVLLAPTACAGAPFGSVAERGDAFAAAVRRRAAVPGADTPLPSTPGG